jgi:hypothetical protein
LILQCYNQDLKSENSPILIQNIEDFEKAIKSHKNNFSICGNFSDDILQYFNILNYHYISASKQVLNSISYLKFSNKVLENLVNTEPHYIKSVYVAKKIK